MCSWKHLDTNLFVTIHRVGYLSFCHSWVALRCLKRRLVTNWSSWSLGSWLVECSSCSKSHQMGKKCRAGGYVCKSGILVLDLPHVKLIISTTDRLCLSHLSSHTQTRMRPVVIAFRGVFLEMQTVELEIKGQKEKHLHWGGGGEEKHPTHHMTLIAHSAHHNTTQRNCQEDNESEGSKNL